MATVIIDGNEYEYTVINGTQDSISMATNGTNIYVDKYSKFKLDTKVQIKYGMKGGGVATALVTIVQEDDKFRGVAKVGGSWAGGAAAVTVTEAIVAFAAGFGATLSAPVVIGIGVTSGVVLSTAGSESVASLYDMVKSWFGYGSGESEITELKRDKNGIIITTTNFNQELNSINYIASKESKVELFGDTTLKEYLKIDSTNKTATVSANTKEAEAAIINDVLNNKANLVDKVSNDGQTFNIKNANNNLLVRNAIDSIPTVSFLLSHIDIKSGEVLDIGNKGLYTIKSGDTMSEIAESKGMTTQQLLKLNTWLIDDGRVSFNQNKVLVDVNGNFLTNKNHVYQGTSAEDRLNCGVYDEFCHIVINNRDYKLKKKVA